MHELRECAPGGNRGKPSAEPAPRPIVEVLAAAIVMGIVAGLLTGLLDAGWSWSMATQFVHGATKLRFTGYVMLVYGLVGAAVALIAASGALVVVRATRLRDAWRALHRAHAARRAADPRAVLAVLAVAVAAVPVTAVTLGLLYVVLLQVAITRHSMSLIVVLVMMMTLAAAVFVIPVALVLGRLLELPLRALAERPGFMRWLSAFHAPLVVVGGALLLAIATGLAVTWNSLEIRGLRGPLNELAFAAVAAIPARVVARRADRWRRDRPRWIRRLIWAALPIASLGLLVGIGGDPQVVKAASSYTQLGGSVTRLVRRLFDSDGDGYARVLGGGDCDDGDASIHPQARDVPGDGIDQDCVPGDGAVPRAADNAFAPVPPAIPPDMKVLFITIDTLRADHLGMYGYRRATSPNLDRLAADGFVFANGWSHSSWTSTSMPSILTGRLPLEARGGEAPGGTASSQPPAFTIGEAFTQLGFITGAITNLPYFDTARHLRRGFAEFDNENAQLHGRVELGATRGSSSVEQTAKALQFVDRHASNRWFLWVHYFDTHYRYERHPDGPMFGTKQMDLYDGEIRFTDEALGTLFRGLRARGQYDHTMIVITSDHGESFGEHDVWEHGVSLYTPETRVPFLMRIPGLPGRRLTTPIGHTDLFATIINLAGGKPNSEMTGRSLVDAITGEGRDRVVLQQFSRPGAKQLRGAASRDCHVIYNAFPDTSWEVYRIDRDPLELDDLSETTECATTRRALEAWCNEHE